MTDRSIAPTRLDHVTPERARRMRFLPDLSSGMTTVFIAPPGWGKSRTMARGVAWQMAWRGQPVLYLDPSGKGGGIDNFLDKLIRQDKSVQQAIGQRVRLVSIAGESGRIAGWPLLSRSYGATLYDASQLWPDVVLRQDQKLLERPLLGWNSFHPLATAASMICLALGLGISDAIDLVLNPETWRDQGLFARVLQVDPSVTPAVAYFRDDFIPNPRDRSQRAAAFLAKARLVTWDDRLRATFDAPAPAIDWDEVMAKRLIVLIDFSGVTDEMSLQLTMLVILRSFTTWLKRRGQGRHLRAGLLIDELSALAAGVATDQETIAADLRELIARLARSHGLAVVLGLQEMAHLSEPIQAVLAMAGNALFGSTSSYETAMSRARRFDAFDELSVKYWRPVYGSSGYSYEGSVLIDWDPVFRTVEEQVTTAARKYLTLGRYEWLAAISRGEGHLPTETIRLSTAHLDAGQYVDEEQVACARRILIERDWPEVSDVLAQIQQRRGLAFSETGSLPPTLRPDPTPEPALPFHESVSLSKTLGTNRSKRPPPPQTREETVRNG